jgi:FixJ family two-component response regulator
MTDRLPNRPTVIVVDDDAGVRSALRFSLEVEGFEVVTCSSAEDLLELGLPEDHGCLVLDDRLPGMSGMDALEILRRRGVDIPTIVITSAPDPALRRRALLANARLIEKPLLSDLLLGAIRALS